MIRGFFKEEGGRSRPFVVGRLAIPAQGIDGEVDFLVDTGADSTLLGPRDVMALRLDAARLAPGKPSTGVSGRIRTASVEAIVTLDNLSFGLLLRILLPAGEQEQDVSRIPSLLGRDVLSQFALFIEERTRRVLLLEAHEADSLNLP